MFLPIYVSPSPPPKKPSSFLFFQLKFCTHFSSRIHESHINVVFVFWISSTKILTIRKEYYLNQVKEFNAAYIHKILTFRTLIKHLCQIPSYQHLFISLTCTWLNIVMYFFPRNIQCCAHHVHVNTGDSYCDIYKENCKIKQQITEQNIKFLFKVCKYDRGDRRDSEVRGQEIKTEVT